MHIIKAQETFFWGHCIFLQVCAYLMHIYACSKMRLMAFLPFCIFKDIMHICAYKTHICAYFENAYLCIFCFSYLCIFCAYLCMWYVCMHIHILILHILAHFRICIFVHISCIFGTSYFLHISAYFNLHSQAYFSIFTLIMPSKANQFNKYSKTLVENC